LKKAGYTASVFEASNRVGGRMFSATDMLAPGIVTELGGEFIDSGHLDIINLANEFGLPLLDRLAPNEASYTEYSFYFNGQPYSMTDMVNQASLYVTQLAADIYSTP